MRDEYDFSSSRKNPYTESQPSAQKEESHMKTPVWVVREVVPLEDYTLLLTFADGSKRLYDARHLLSEAVFADLRSLPFFLTARVCGDTVIWNDDVNIAPEHLYECSIPVK